MRFLEPTKGDLWLDARPYRELSHSEIRAHLAYVEQDTPVVPGTIRDNLVFSHPGASDDELAGVLDAVRLTERIDALDDGLTEKAIHDCIRTRANAGTVVTIAHRLSTVLDADTIVVMESGRIRAQGSHDELLATDALYRELVQALRIADSADGVTRRAADASNGSRKSARTA